MHTMNAYRRGSGIIILIITIAMLSSIIALSTAQISNVMFNSLKSSSIAIQAQQFSENKANILKATSYENLNAQNKQEIQNTKFSDEVVLGAEKDNDAYLSRTATVNIYYNNEAIPRVSLAVLRTSLETTSNVPTGTVISWYGNLSYLPDGWLLCDGSNGTPDLRNKFITGAGDNYLLGDTGGSDNVKLVANEMPNHFHTYGYHNNNNGGYFLTSGDIVRLPKRANGTYPGKWNGSGGGGYSSWDGGSGFGSGQNLITSYQVSSGVADYAHENRPPFYALYYLIKV